jgi:hypothetical protein
MLRRGLLALAAVVLVGAGLLLVTRVVPTAGPWARATEPVAAWAWNGCKTIERPPTGRQARSVWGW